MRCSLVMTDKQSDSGTSVLSADAAAFVPRATKDDLSLQQFNELPSYMTNCYPFVSQTDVHNLNRLNLQPRPRGRTPTPRPIAPPIFSAGIPMNTFIQAPAPILLQAPSPLVAQNPLWNIRFPPLPLDGARGLLPTPWLSYQAEGLLGALGYRMQPRQRANSIESNRSRSSSLPSSCHGNHTGRGVSSVGIQKEPATRPNDKRRLRNRTVMYIDVAAQTDFPEDIANLTLVDKPNSLYKRASRLRHRYRKRNPGDASTDSQEEVDSDSGYSSPLHRRNQTTSGTHTVPLDIMMVDMQRTGGAGDSAKLNVLEYSGNQSKNDVRYIGGNSAQTNCDITSAPTCYRSENNSVKNGWRVDNMRVNPCGPSSGSNARVNPLCGPSSGNASAAATNSLSLSDHQTFLLDDSLFPALVSDRNLAALAGYISSDNNKKQSLSYAQLVARSGSPGNSQRDNSPDGTPNANTTDGLSCGAVSGLNDDDGDDDRNVRRRRRRRRGRRKSRSNPDSGASCAGNSNYDTQNNANKSESVNNGGINTDSRLNLDTVVAPSLHFEDEDEFPGLRTSTEPRYKTGGAALSYCDILKSSKQGQSRSQSQGRSQGESLHGSDGEGLNRSRVEHTKTDRKMKKRREMANEAAEKELLEISIEQQVLKEMSLKQQKPPGGGGGGGGKKSKQPIALNIADMISALEREQDETEHRKKKKVPTATLR